MTAIVNDRGAGAYMAGQALSVADLFRICYTAGFRGQDLAVAVAIALAESSGQPTAQGDVNLEDATWGPSVGLFQIRSLKGAKPGDLRDAAANIDPLTNARAAFALYQANKARGGSGFQDWTTFTGATAGGRTSGQPKVASILPEVQRQLAAMGGENGVALQVYSAAANKQPLYSGQPAGQQAAPPQTVPGAPQLGTPQPAGGGGGPTGGQQYLMPGMGGAGVAPSAALPPNASEAQIVDYVNSNYGFMGWALNDPELRQVIITAAQGGWDSNKLQGAIFNTNWWKTHNEGARQFQALRNMDPAKAEQQLSQLATSIRVWATKMGLTIDQDRARQIGEHALSVGMTEDEVRQNLLGEQHYAPGKPVGGDLGGTMASVKAKAAAYLVPISDETAFEWARKIALGEADDAGLVAYLSGMAKSRLPQLAHQIDMGFTPQNILEPYQQLLAKELEVSPGMVNFLDDPRYSAVLSTPDGKGGNRMMSLSEAQSYVRGLPEWRSTLGARQLGASVSLSLGRQMGVIA